MKHPLMNSPLVQEGLPHCSGATCAVECGENDWLDEQRGPEPKR